MTSAQVPRWAILLILAGLATAPQAAAQSSDYHILLTNDDGVSSAGLRVLVTELARLGTVHVVAPCGERSGSSMAVALRDQLVLRTVPVVDGVMGHCVDTTPAGAVLLALASLSPPGGFDLVVSGINRGANVGTASHMSGTIGAAMMGAFHRIPAVAASYGGRAPDFTYSARFVARFIAEMRRHPAEPGLVYSINIPRATEAEIAGVTVAPMGGIELLLGYEELPTDSAGRHFRPRIGLATTGPAGSDTEAYLAAQITITPLRFDWTATEAVGAVMRWNLSHKLTP